MKKPSSLPNSTPKARLLIVDDEPRIRAMLERALNLMGYQAEATGSGSEALTLLAGMPFDLMVLDLHLPGMDGLEVMRRARQRHPDLQIIILTGHPTLESANAAVNLHAADYLIKPASVREIAGAIQQALQRRAKQWRR